MPELRLNERTKTNSFSEAPEEDRMYPRRWQNCRNMIDDNHEMDPVVDLLKVGVPRSANDECEQRLRRTTTDLEPGEVARQRQSGPDDEQERS
jgi:hypothetical protein